MKDVDLFCGTSSFGIPFPRENKNHIGYFDIIKTELQRENNVANSINISSLNKNHTWDLEKIIKDKYNLKQIKNIRIQSIEALQKTNFLFKLIIPNDIIKKIEQEDVDDELIFKDVYVKSAAPIFLYSAGPNDFFSYIGAGPVELLNKQIRSKLPENLFDLLNKTIDNVDRNIALLRELNGDAEIYVFGFYYAPLFEMISKIIYLEERIKYKKRIEKNKMKNIINRYNMLLKKICDKYDNVNYIDVSYLENHCAQFDFHPNTKGNQMIAKSVIDTMNENKKLILNNEN